MKTENPKTENPSDKIVRLEAHRRDVDFQYQNSSWGAGPRYRAELDQIDAELLELRKVAA